LKAPPCQGRPILDLEAGKGVGIDPIRTKDLTQGLHAIEKTLGAWGYAEDLRGLNMEDIGFHGVGFLEGHGILEMARTRGEAKTGDVFAQSTTLGPGKTRKLEFFGKLMKENIL